MRITTVSVRNFRSLRSVTIENCASLNIFIGKNNSGKSSILSAINIALSDLDKGEETSEWPVYSRQQDEFFLRKMDRNIQIGIEFCISPEENAQIRALIRANLEGVELALNASENVRSLSVIISGCICEGFLARYIEKLCLGNLKFDSEILNVEGSLLYSVSPEVASEQIINNRKLRVLAEQEEQLERAGEELKATPVFSRERERDQVRYYTRRISGSLPRSLRQKFDTAAVEAGDLSSFNTRFSEMISEIHAQMDETKAKPFTQVIQSLSGSTRKVPPYLRDILILMSESRPLNFKETKKGIGPEDAAQLLSMKMTRGGPQQLSALQSTVKNLLGVSVDAFSAGRGASGSNSNISVVAEMDIDDFLVEANGAGIRESLRIILDLELQKPVMALIEEPEVHLHPGLEKVMHSYLVEKGRTVQLFVATHSTNFLDVSDSQNVYSVSRSNNGESTINLALTHDQIISIPDEVGLKPSTVFMFDKLIFVEGPSDEAVLRSLADKLSIDLSSSNVGIVHMGGASSLYAFSNDKTIDLLSKRRIPMLFLIDRDERGENEMTKVKERVGDRARVHWLKKRELENYLLVPSAIQMLISEKRKTNADRDLPLPTYDELGSAIAAAASSEQESVIKRLVYKQFLSPIYIDRKHGQSPSEKIQSAIEEMTLLKESIDDKAKALAAGISEIWAKDAVNKASGSEILTSVLSKYSLAYRKDRDAGRLASFLAREEIAQEIASTIRSFIG